MSRRLLAGALSTLVLLAVPSSAAAQGTAQAQGSERLQVGDLGPEVTIGFGRGITGNAWSVVEVAASPRVPIAGEVEARTQGQLGGAVLRAPLEVAAGATKVVHLLIPPADDVRFTFVASDGQRLGFGSARAGPTDVLVGGFGRAPHLPETLTSVATDRAIRGVPIDPAVLALGPRAFEALDALVVPARELAALDPARRDHLAVAVAQGLDLIVPTVAGDAPVDLPWVPATGADTAGLRPADDAWAVTAADVGGRGDEVVAAAVRAGRGRVVATAGAPGDDGLAATSLWPTLLQPRDDVGPVIPALQEGNLRASLFGRAAALPGTTGTALFVLAFLLAVGPLNVLLLRRLRRRELGWVTVPAITVVFTLLAVGSAAARAPTSTPMLRASWWLDGVGQELDAIGLQSPGRGTVSATLPGRRDAVVADPWGSLTAATRHAADHTVVGVPMQSLQAATVIGWGPAAGPPPLDVSAEMVGTTLTATITNVSDADLTDVQLGTASRWLGVEDLPAGATAEVELDGLGDLPRSRDADRFMGGGVQFPDGPGGGDDGDQRGPTAGLDLLRGGVLDEAPGTVWVVGVTTATLGGVTPEVRGNLHDRGSAVAVGVTPRHAGDTVGVHQVSRGVLRGDSFGWRPGPTMIEGAQQIELRFRLPSLDAVGPLRSALDRGGPLRGNDFMDGEMDGCFEVTEITPDGEELPPEERCGPMVACPDTAMECSDDGFTSTARLRDGTRQRAVRIPGVREERGALAGGEVWHVRDRAWVPAGEAFTDGVADRDDLVSPFGEVLVRVRGAGMLDLSQRGLAVGGDG